MTMNAHESSGGVALAFELHHRMDRALEHAGLGVSEMADYMGVTRETIGRWIDPRPQQAEPGGGDGLGVADRVRSALVGDRGRLARL